MGRQFVVATVNSLEGYPIQDYAYRLGRAWKIGSAKNNDGVLLLVAPNERKVWIATGYGAGGFMTDAMAGVIIAGGNSSALQAEATRLWRRYRSGRRRDYQADEPSAGGSSKSVAAATQAQQQRQHSSGGALPGFSGS